MFHIYLSESNGEFGAGVAVAADTRRIAVGGPRTSLDAENLRNGRVYTYEYDGTDFVQLATPIDGPLPDDSRCLPRWRRVEYGGGRGGVDGFRVRLEGQRRIQNVFLAGMLK